VCGYIPAVCIVSLIKMIKQEATYFLLQHKVLLPAALFLLNNDTYRKVCIALHTHTQHTTTQFFWGLGLWVSEW